MDRGPSWWARTAAAPQLFPDAHAVGGSHAQRDVIDLTLIAAAARSGQADLTRALVTERTRRKPSASASARALALANGGHETWLAW